KPLAFGLLHASPEGVVLADPSIGQSVGLQQAQVRVFAGGGAPDAGSSIGGLIIHDYNFRNFLLARQRFDARGDDRLFISRWNDGGDGSRRRRRNEGAVWRSVLLRGWHCLLDAEEAFRDPG